MRTEPIGSTVALGVVLTFLIGWGCTIPGGKRRPTTHHYCHIEVAPLKGQVGVPYRGKVTFTSDWVTDPVLWISKPLPPGLTLDPSTGIISGIPTAAGQWSPVFRIRDRIHGHPLGENYSWPKRYHMRIYRADD